jgi:ABC-type polysaccharide/polyol phosphate transport system ATPase subunit
VNNDIVIQVNDLGKRFKIYQNPWSRALEWASYGRKIYHQDFWALRGISFGVKRGECLGVIGPNGAGKSTLLKILTRSLYPTTGMFEIRGNVLSLLELGTGFNQELTGRQNVYRSSQLLGFPEGYVSDRTQDIEEFAEIGEFFDRPIKTYSTGMYVRLAFSMFVFLEPEVLVVDEALSVGDIFFQQKCFSTMRKIIAGGTTCLFVSHDTAAIANLSDRVLLLNQGTIDFLGSPEEAVSRYSCKIGNRKTSVLSPVCKVDDPSNIDDKLMSPEEIIKHDILTSDRGHGAGGLEVLAARVTDKNGRDTLQVRMLEPLYFYCLIRAKEAIAEPCVGITLHDRLGNMVFAAGTPQLRTKLPSLKPGQELAIKFEVILNVQAGEYSFGLVTAEPSEEGPNIGYFHDRHQKLGPIVVIADFYDVLPFYGMAQLPMKVSYKTSNDDFHTSRELTNHAGNGKSIE